MHFNDFNINSKIKTMRITSNFDSGNIEVLSAEKTDDIQLNIRKDTETDMHQWFHFRLTGAKDCDCKITIANSDTAAYPIWEGYKVVASYDRQTWFRVETTCKNNVLKIHHTPEHNSVFYAYFAPYSYEQHLDLISSAQHSDLCTAETIGETVAGRDIDMLVVGDASKDKKNIWIVARQHPGESMAEWFMQGLIFALLDEDDPVSKKLLQKANFYLVPNMNIDGSIAGNQRHNVAGANLNREWRTPSLEKSPEVFYVRQKMEQVGVDMFLDIHGDEELPYNFVSGIEGIPGYTKELDNIIQKFLNNWLQISPDFQREHGYPLNEPGKANLDIASKYVGHAFECVALTIEMPYKDNNNLPDDNYGWSPERSILFGESLLNSILYVVDDL